MELRFALVGLSHKSAPIEVREQAFIPETGVGECVRRLIDHDLIESGLLLTTCNRIELYAMVSADENRDRLVQSFGWWPHQLPIETWNRHAYQLTGEDAMTHLFRVAAGLDSMVLGEAQILGQIKEALAQAQRVGGVDLPLRLIVQGAIRAGKRVRHETAFGGDPVSVSHAAVAKAEELLGNLKGLGVLLVGAGAMSQVALRLLRARGVDTIYLTSRSLERADQVARPMGGKAVDFESIEGVIDRVDLIISSSNAPYHLFDPVRVSRLQVERAGRPLLILDIAIPRDVHPEAGRVPGVHLFNLDELTSVAATGQEQRASWTPAAERIVEEELAVTRRSLEVREAAPFVQALVRRMEEVRDRELERHLARAPSDAQSREAMKALAESLTAKFLHGPIRSLRQSPDPRREASVFTEAFDLKPEDKSRG